MKLFEKHSRRLQSKTNFGTHKLMANFGINDKRRRICILSEILLRQIRGKRNKIARGNVVTKLRSTVDLLLGKLFYCYLITMKRPPYTLEDIFHFISLLNKSEEVLQLGCWRIEKLLLLAYILKLINKWKLEGEELKLLLIKSSYWSYYEVLKAYFPKSNSWTFH